MTRVRRRIPAGIRSTRPAGRSGPPPGQWGSRAREHAVRAVARPLPGAMP